MIRPSLELVPQHWTISSLPSALKSPTSQATRSEAHTSELQSRPQLVCRLLLVTYRIRPSLDLVPPHSTISWVPSAPTSLPSFPTRRSSDLMSGLSHS